MRHRLEKTANMCSPGTTHGLYAWPRAPLAGQSAWHALRTWKKDHPDLGGGALRVTISSLAFQWDLYPSFLVGPVTA